jgi:N-glycosylase/DNA lyase
MSACCGGMRILNQPIWECLISFILSSNNNVKRISGIVERLSERFGEDMGGYYVFPTPHALAQAGAEGVAACGAGYRAEYVAEAARAVASGTLDLECLPRLGYAEAQAKLMKLLGVGEKVADCVLLYSCVYREAFPVDVWVRKAVTSYYPTAGKTPKEIHAFADRRFGKLAGLAQQYLFYFERCIKENGATLP